MEGGVKLWKRVIISVVLVFLITTLAFSTTMLNTPVVAAYVLTESGAQPLQTTTTGKTIITGLHAVQSPVNITGLSTLKGNIIITSSGATSVKMGPGVTIRGINNQPAILDIYAKSFTQAESVTPGGVAYVNLIGNEAYPAKFEAEGNITIGAVYDAQGSIIRGCLSLQASNMYMYVNSSASNAGGLIGDLLNSTRLIRSDTRTAIRVLQGTLIISTKEYNEAGGLISLLSRLLRVQIGATADVVITINCTHVKFDIEVPGIISEEWIGSNVVSLTSYNGIANFSKLAEDGKLPSIRFEVLGIGIQTIDLDDLIIEKATGNNYYIDIALMRWSAGTSWETWTGQGINPMILLDGSVVLLNNSRFMLRSNSTVAMTFYGGSTGVQAGLKINGSGSVTSPLVHIEALNVFTASWGCNSYMWVRNASSISMSNAEVISDGQEISSGATVTVNGYQEYPVSTVISTCGMNLTGSLLLERDYGAGRRYVFEVQGNISMPSGSSYISADLVQLSGDSVISGVVSINGKMKIVGSLMSVGDSDVNGVSVLRNAVMAASGVIEVEGSQLINGSLTMSGGGMQVNSSGIFVTGTTEVSGGLRIEGRLKVTGDLTMEGESIKMEILPTSMSIVSGSIETENGYVEVAGDYIKMGGDSSVIRGSSIEISVAPLTSMKVLLGSISMEGGSSVITSGGIVMNGTRNVIEGTIEIVALPSTSMRVESGSIETLNGFSEVTGGGIRMGGESSVISGVITISGRNLISGSLMSVGDSDVNGVSVLRNAVMAASGVIEVEGSQLINGSLTMTDSTTDIGVSGILIDGCVRVDGSLRVSGTLTIMGNATMNGEIIEMSGSSKITGHVELSGSMNTNNLLTGTVSLTASSLVTSGSTVIRDGRIDVVNGVLKVTKAGTEIACSVKIMGDIESTGTLTLSNARISGTTLIMAPTITYGATLVRGLMQILMSQSLPASMLINPMFTFGQVTMAQSMIVGSTNIEGTMTVTPNNVIITGTTEIVGALNAFTAPLIGVGSTVAMQSASALTSAGPLSLPSLALALSPLNLAMFALIGAIVARIIVPPVALAAGRAARRVQKKYFAPETRAYMLYYRTRTRLSNAARLTASLTRYAAMKTRESIFNAVSRPASRMASVELALQQQRKKLPMWFKSWHDKFLSRRLRRTRRIRMSRLRKQRTRINS
ncbi:MAG: hypothetical protein QW461_01565 [Candidatus Jordarchaeales archaeon]